MSTSLAGSPWAVIRRGAGTGLMCDANERSRRRQIAGAGGDEEEVSGAKLGHCHIALDHDVAAHMEWTRKCDYRESTYRRAKPASYFGLRSSPTPLSTNCKV